MAFYRWRGRERGRENTRVGPRRASARGCYVFEASPGAGGASCRAPPGATNKTSFAANAVHYIA